MTVKRVVTPNRWVGASTETKPTAATHPNIRDGDTYYAYNTGILYITHDLGTTWTEKLDPSPGVGATSLGKAEDAAHSSGDTGVASLGVRKDMPGTLVSATGDYENSQHDQFGNTRVVNDPNPFFGQPELRHDNEGWGQWEYKALQAKFKDSYDTNRHFRYGNWAVHLNGGPQASGESWASVSVPIKDMRVQDVTSIAYDWYAQYTGSSHILDIGPNLVFSAYDPDDHAKRVDFNTYAVDNNLLASDGLANRPIEAGVYTYKMTSTDATERVYYYADNDGSHTPCATDGADYYWSQYITDTIFKDWLIYRIQVMHGYWGSTRSTGDVWIMNFRVNDIPVKWEPSEADRLEIIEKEKNMFGEATLKCRNNGDAVWVRPGTSPYDQKSSTSWLANLYGGTQSAWDDWARVEIPVNEMHVPDLKTAKWSYYIDEAEAFGVNMVIFVHDPFHPDYRAEITQQADIATLIKATGWNEHVLNPSTDQFYFYGETTTKTNLTAAAPNYYGWDDFVADELFNTWTIYKISFDWGWQSGNEIFKDVYVADVELNGKMIPMKPDSGGTGRIGHRFVEHANDVVALTLAPKTPFRLLNIDIHLSAALADTELVTITKDSGYGTNTYSDTVIFSENLFTGTRLSYHGAFGEGYEFDTLDELDIALSANSLNRNIGINVAYEIL